VPRGSSLLLSNTAALSSKRMYEPSLRRTSFFVRTTTALLTVPFTRLVTEVARLASAVVGAGVPARPLPADFRAAEVSPGKIKREGALELRLEPTEDILAGLSAAHGEEQTIIGFAAEHGEGGLERARAKLERKGADLIVLNDVSDPEIGFESERNAVTLIAATGETEVPIDSKDAVAEAILDEVARLREKQSQPAG